MEVERRGGEVEETKGEEEVEVEEEEEENEEVWEGTVEIVFFFYMFYV